MSLCDTCSSIAFDDLPAFPTAEYNMTISGLRHAHMLVVKPGVSKEAIAAVSRTRHHASLASLRTAAEDGCQLCKLIVAQADMLLAELEALSSEPYRKDYLPTFDMWLSQRQNGGQGFCVMSNSSTHAAGATVIAVAAFAFVVSDELQENQVSGVPPQYLIDVQNYNARGTVMVVELDGQARHRYAALSYASEPAIVSYWVQNNIQKENELAIENFPKLFQDAIYITSILDIQYVWIDSLCTPNDSWPRDSEQAGAVYENAYLMLSATGATDISDGLLFQRPLSNLVQVPCGVGADGHKLVSVVVLPLDKEIFREEYIKMKQQPIFNDIWQFQSRVLSCRNLHFASDQMYYESLHHFASEDGLLQRLRFHTAVRELPKGTEHFRRRCLDEDPRARWCALVWDYGQYPSNGRPDKLRALSNVARAFHRLESDAYIAGHWRKSLPDTLFWRPLSSTPSGERNAPSWSWASIDGIPSMGLGYKRVRNYTSKIIDVRSTLADSENIFGSVTSAELEIEAPLVPLKLLDQPDSTDRSHMFLIAEDDDERGFYAGFDTIKREYSHSASAVREMQLFALILMVTRAEGGPPRACGPANSICALIVTPVDKSGEKMKRLGALSAAEARLPYAKLASTRTVILV